LFTLSSVRPNSIGNRNRSSGNIVVTARFSLGDGRGSSCISDQRYRIISLSIITCTIPSSLRVSLSTRATCWSMNGGAEEEAGEETYVQTGMRKRKKERVPRYAPTSVSRFVGGVGVVIVVVVVGPRDAPSRSTTPHGALRRSSRGGGVASSSTVDLFSSVEWL